MGFKFEESISKVDYIINKLSFEDYQKIPQNVINFFDNNSNDNFFEAEDLSIKSVMNSLDENDLKFLKIIDYYINKE